ncbi:uncharacterized protein PGTG_19059 [Puccinia graminis f. sp. tritici CRL 75-36-700-3]|uniref:Uncharacterized protein n=1 Tax=Puccinia graminis f. sp. tritici (strain CRL 75-36-700-3 / race SCCL) TaxID=418459 RepID=E3L9R6_PUCGT|nr:uncharacterized protein PGTG_19059 [Puccinia graminis f. sp. tritici CRL 75-36-700-3]EFP93291.1 hypothetical protein PGTG_19059 [Puccinia graminis f. sp. tritici CRL 75-36-700-3]
MPTWQPLGCQVGEAMERDSQPTQQPITRDHAHLAAKWASEINAGGGLTSVLNWIGGFNNRRRSISGAVERDSQPNHQPRKREHAHLAAKWASEIKAGGGSPLFELDRRGQNRSAIVFWNCGKGQSAHPSAKNKGPCPLGSQLAAKWASAIKAGGGSPLFKSDRRGQKRSAIFFRGC